MNYVYILRSKKNGRYYIGSTSDLERRIAEHHRGHAKATKAIRPLEFVFKKEYASLVEARQEEKQLKKYKRRDYIEKYIDR